MLVNDFFARMMNEADDKTVLFLARILFYNINNLKDRDKFLERAGISQDEYRNFLEALGKPYDMPTLRAILQKLYLNAADKIKKRFANK